MLTRYSQSACPAHPAQATAHLGAGGFIGAQLAGALEHLGGGGAAKQHIIADRRGRRGGSAPCAVEFFEEARIATISTS